VHGASASPPARRSTHRAADTFIQRVRREIAIAHRRRRNGATPRPDRAAAASRSDAEHRAIVRARGLAH